MMQINNKFDIGQEVYVIRKVKINVPCSACNGEGHKIIDGSKFYCSKCSGEGFLRYETKKEYQVIGLKTIILVKSITQLQGKELVPKTTVIYNVETDNGTLKEVPEHHLFTNGEEAIKYCELLNKELEDQNHEP